MDSLNKISQFLAGEMGISFSVPLLERLKHDIKGYRSLFIRQEFDRDGAINDAVFQQRFNIELDLVENLDNCFYLPDCQVKRTINKVPEPVRLKTDTLFSFIGSGSTQFSYKKVGDVQYTSFNRHPDLITPYTYVNGYVYVFKNPKLKYLTIESIFTEPQEAQLLCQDKDIICHDIDDLDFACSKDMVKRIEDTIINNKLKYVQLENDLEVKLADKKK